MLRIVLTDTNTQRKIKFVTFPYYGGLRNHIHHTACNYYRILKGSIGKNNCKLITTVTGCNIDLTYACTKTPADLLELARKAGMTEQDLAMTVPTDVQVELQESDP